MITAASCLECSTPIGTEEHVACCICKNDVHVRCLRSGNYVDASCKSESATWFKALCASRFWRFVCKSCVAEDIPSTSVRHINSSNVDDRLLLIEEKLQQLLQRDEPASSIGKKSFAEVVGSQLKTAVADATKISFEKCLKDSESARETAKTLIFEGVVLSSENTGQKSHDADLAIAKSLVLAASNDVGTVSSVTRLGVTRLGVNNGLRGDKPPPLKVVFNSSDSALAVLRGRWRLRRDEVFQNVFVFPFLSQGDMRRKEILKSATYIANEKNTSEPLAVLYNNKLERFGLYNVRFDNDRRMVCWDKGEVTLPADVMAAGEKVVDERRQKRFANRRVSSTVVSSQPKESRGATAANLP